MSRRGVLSDAIAATLKISPHSWLKMEIHPAVSLTYRRCNYIIMKLFGSLIRTTRLRVLFFSLSFFEEISNDAKEEWLYIIWYVLQRVLAFFASKSIYVLENQYIVRYRTHSKRSWFQNEQDYIDNFMHFKYKLYLKWIWQSMKFNPLLLREVN